MPDFSDLITATVAVRDPATPAADLMAIALAQPGLWTRIARHRNAYPALLDWLDQVGDDEVHAALAQRASTAAPVSKDSSPTMAPPRPAESSAPIPVPPSEQDNSNASVVAGAPLSPPQASAQGPSPSSPTFVYNTGLPQGATWDSQQFPPPQNISFTPAVTPIPGPPTKERRLTLPRRWPFILGGAVILVLVLALIGWFVVRPLVTSSPNSDSVVPDLLNQPTQTAPVLATVGMDPQFAFYYHSTLFDAGSTKVGLVATNVDFAQYAQDNQDATWYEGYDEDYAAGLADGTRCQATPQPNRISDPLGWILWSTNLPTYCFSKYIGSLASFSSKAGYHDGFTDGVDATPGATQAHAPVELAQTSRIVGFSLTDASIVWTFDLADTGLSQAFLPSIPAPNGQGKVAMLVRPSQDGQPSALLVLSVADGATAGLVTIPAASVVLGYANDTVLLYTEESGDGRLVAYKDSGDLAWTKDVAEPYFSETCTGRILAGQWTCAQGGYLRVADGQPASFGVDIGCEATGVCTSYTTDNQGNVFRATWQRTRPSSISFTKWNTTSDKPLWKNELLASSFFTDDSRIYAVVDGALNAYHLGSGALDWTAEAVSGQPAAAVGKYVVVYDLVSHTVIVVDSSSHAVATTFDRVDAVFAGERVLYTWDAYAFTLTAHDTKSKDFPTLWNVPAKTPPRIIGSTFVFMLPGNEFYLLT